MAAWAPKGAWAQQSENDEGGAPPPPEAFPALADLGAKLDQAFPTLGETLNKKVSKKKGQPMSLSEFNAGGAVSSGGGRGSGAGAFRAAGSRGVNLDDIQLPTGPRAREEGEEEDSRRLGGGGAYSRDYGAERGGREERGGGAGPGRPPSSQ